MYGNKKKHNGNPENAKVVKFRRSSPSSISKTAYYRVFFSLSKGDYCGSDSCIDAESVKIGDNSAG